MENLFNYSKFEKQISEQFSYYKANERPKHFRYCLDFGTFCFILDVPTIKTQFCFDDSWDYKGAQEEAANARTNVNYFLSQNMEQLDRKIKSYQKALENMQNWPQVYKYYFLNNYSGDNTFKYLDHWSFYSNLEKPLNSYGWAQPIPSDAIPATTEDIKKILAAYEIIKQDFKKRLTTYLKRFGLSKIDSWTYWGQA